MKNKKIIIFVSLVVFLTVVFFLFVIRAKQQNKNEIVSENYVKQAPAKKSAEDISKHENLEKIKNDDFESSVDNGSGALRCVWGKDEKSIPYYIVYFDGATRMRSENRIPLDPSVPEKGRAYEIIDKGLQYEWDFTSSNGRKTIIPLEEGYTYEESFASMMDRVVGGNDYTCQPWKIDESFFLPPANIKFINIEEESRKTTPLKCEWNNADNEYEVYFNSDGKKYYKIKMKDSGEIEYRMYDNKWSYRWTSSVKEGTRAVHISEDIASESADAREEVIKASKYSCQEWVVDESLFIAPSEIKFIEKDNR